MVRVRERYKTMEDMLRAFVTDLGVSLRKGMIRFGKQRKLNPRYTGHFKVPSRVGPILYRLELPQELSGTHEVFHVSKFENVLNWRNARRSTGGITDH
ncbi:hypothetical protein Tco_1049659 [Tanacetum coccineum]